MADLLTVVTPATASRLTTRDAAKATLGITGSDSDAAVDALIDRASAAIVSSCRGRVFGRETVAETWRALWGRRWHRGMDRLAEPLMLARTPIVSVTSVTEGTATLTTDDYEIDTGVGLVWRLNGGCRIYWGCCPIVVTYTAGWLLPDDVSRNLPYDLEAICLDLISRAFYSTGRDASVQTEITEGVGRVSYFAQPGGLMALDDAGFARLARFMPNP